MTVAELKEKLSFFDDNLQVVIPCYAPIYTYLGVIRVSARFAIRDTYGDYIRSTGDGQSQSVVIIEE